MTEHGTALPIAASWFSITHLTSAITLISEPHAHPFVRGNIWHVRGAVRDLVVDAGLGVGSLLEEYSELFENDPVLVVTHTHLDHVGSAREFADRRWHIRERDHAPIKSSLRGPDLGTLLGIPPEVMPSLLIDALPSDKYDIDSYDIGTISPSTYVEDGGIIDIGDRTFTVIHCPGHTPGSVVLYEPSLQELFSGDVVYEGTLLDQLHESNRVDYRESLKRLRELDVRVVYPGHGDRFDGVRLREIIDRYLESR